MTSVHRSNGLPEEPSDSVDPSVSELEGPFVRTVPSKRERGSPVADSPRCNEPDTEMPLLEIRNLAVQFSTGSTNVTVIEDLNLTVHHGEIVGLVGESGCGKTVTSMSIMRLLASPPAEIITGQILFEGQDLLSLPFQALRKIRGASLAMVFQDPMSSLDPAFTVGNLLTETIRIHSQMKRSVARERACELLQMVRIPDPLRRMKEYPHQLSGGTRQRVGLALALANQPKMLIADEPTTALDVTVQAEILELLRSIQEASKMSVLFVTHDLGVVAEICDRVAVMYAGEIVEEGKVVDVFENPHHPYTKGLLGAMPQFSSGRSELAVIAGQVPPLQALPSGCRFHPRCPYALPACQSEPVQLRRDGDRQSRCIRVAELFQSSPVSESLRHL